MDTTKRQWQRPGGGTIGELSCISLLLSPWSTRLIDRELNNGRNCRNGFCSQLPVGMMVLATAAAAGEVLLAAKSADQWQWMVDEVPAVTIYAAAMGSAAGGNLTTESAELEGPGGLELVDGSDFSAAGVWLWYCAVALPAAVLLFASLSKPFLRNAEKFTALWVVCQAAVLAAFGVLSGRPTAAVACWLSAGPIVYGYWAPLPPLGSMVAGLLATTIAGGLLLAGTCMSDGMSSSAGDCNNLNVEFAAAVVVIFHLPAHVLGAAGAWRWEWERKAGFGWAATLTKIERRRPKQLAVLELSNDGVLADVDDLDVEDGGGQAGEWLRLLLPEHIAKSLLRTDQAASADAAASNYEDVAVMAVALAGQAGLGREPAGGPGVAMARMRDSWSLAARLAERHGVCITRQSGPLLVATAGGPLGFGSAGVVGAAADAARLAQFGLALIENCGAWADERWPAQAGGRPFGVGVRIGLGRGAVGAAVIGYERFGLGLWGEGLELARALQTHAELDTICVCPATATALPARDFRMDSRHPLLVPLPKAQTVAGHTLLEFMPFAQQQPTAAQAAAGSGTLIDGGSVLAAFSPSGLHIAGFTPQPPSTPSTPLPGARRPPSHQSFILAAAGEEESEDRTPPQHVSRAADEQEMESEPAVGPDRPSSWLLTVADGGSDPDSEQDDGVRAPSRLVDECSVEDVRQGSEAGAPNPGALSRPPSRQVAVDRISDDLSDTSESSDDEYPAARNLPPPPPLPPPATPEVVFDTPVPPRDMEGGGCGRLSSDEPRLAARSNTVEPSPPPTKPTGRPNARRHAVAAVADVAPRAVG